jgi:hypothetical protein
VLRFADLPILPSSVFLTDSIAKAHQGCFVIICTSQAVYNKDGDYISDSLIFCPACKTFDQSPVKPDCATSYFPDGRFQALTPRVFTAVSIGRRWLLGNRELEQYGVISIRNVNVRYRAKPISASGYSNFFLDSASADLDVVKNIIQYHID